MRIIQRLPNLLKRETSGGRYLPLVDGLRFLAILPVVMQHLSERLIRHQGTEFATPVQEDQLAFFFSRGTIGVFIFFAISGFMLTLPFARHHLEGSKKPLLKDYFFRRFTRIEPPYLVWMTVFAVVLLVQGAYSFGEMVPHWLASCFYLHNFIYGEYSVINPVAWSLEIEIQFYLIAPWLVGLFFSIKNKKARQAALLASIFGFVALQHGMGWQVFPIKATLLGQLQHFLVGIWVADCYLSHWKNKPSNDRRLDILVVPALLVMAYTWTSEFWKSIVFVLALMYVLAAAFRGKYFAQLLQNQWVAIIGGMCYTIYLTHLPLLELQMKLTGGLMISEYYLPNLLLQAAFAFPLILISSAVFYLVLEKPFMQRFSIVQIKAQFRALLPSFLTIPPSFWSKMKKITTIFAIVFCLPFFAVAQNEMPISTQFPLPPLDSLIEWAMKKSPALRSQDVWIETQKQTWQLEKKSWANLVSFGGTALVGTNNVLDYQQTTSSSEYISVDRKSGVYNAGVTFRLSLGDVINRDEKANIKRLEWERAQVDRTGLEFQIREEVMVRYDRFQTDLRMIELDVQNVEAMRIAFEVAKEYFEQGNLSVDEYSTALSKNIGAQKQLEQSKLAAQHSYRMLLGIAGI